MTAPRLHPAAVPDSLARRMDARDRANTGVRTQAEVDASAILKQERMDEKALQRLCEQRATYRGVRWFQHLRKTRGNKAGTPDLLFCIHGRPIACELKSATGRLEPEQRDALTAMRADGWSTYVCRSLAEFDGIWTGSTPIWEGA